MADEKTNTAEKQEFVRRRRPARRAILEVARRILLRDGSDGLTPESVIKESGFSAEIVYAYFCNKDELLLSIASDELSMLARAAKENGEPDPDDGDTPDIRELPRMVEGFIAQRATDLETGEGLGPQDDEPANTDAAPETGEYSDDESDSAEFLAEEALAREADEASAEAAFEEPESDYDTEASEKPERKTAEFSIETMRRGIPRTRRRPNQGREIDGIVRELTAGEQQGEAAVSATLARLERRLYLIERNLAEAAEKADADARRAAETPAFSNEDVVAILARVGNLEKRLTDISEDLSAGQKSTLERLRILEATPPAGPSVAEKMPATQEITVEAEEVNLDDTTIALKDTSLESFLAAARQAAKSAGEESARPEDAESDSVVERLKQKAGEFIGRTARMDRKTLLTTIVPIPLIAIGLAVTIWAAMNAGEVAATTDQTASPPGTVVAMSMSAAPQITVSPFDELTSGAEAGNTDAQTALGLAYLNGDGVAANEDFAISWLQLAAENGQPVAQYTLATLYARADNAMYDAETAKYWFQAAAEKGNLMAMNNLAMFYAQGLGTEADITEAAHWFSMAAAFDYRIAQFNLAVLYERGEGVPRDIAEAYKWYALAAAQGDADAQARIAVLAERMEPIALSEAQAAFEAFEPADLDPSANTAPVYPRQRG